MQADPGNTGKVLEEVTQKMQQAKAAAQQFSGTQVTPPPLPQTPPPLPSSTPASGSVPKADVPAETTSSWTKLSGVLGNVGTKLFVVNQAAQVAIMALKAVAGAIEPFVRLNSEMENIQTRFKVMLGDAAKAKAAFAETKQYADVTPFKLSETAAARTKLFSANIEDMDTLKAAGNLAAASGRSIEEAAMAFARLKSGASGEAMEMLRLMNVSRSMFRAEGIEFDSGGQALATAEELTSALKNIVKANFGGMTEEIGKQWSGLWSTLGDTVDNAMRSVSGSSFVTLKSVISDLIQSLNALLQSERLQQFGSAVGSIFGSAVGVVKNFSGLLSPLAGIIGVTLVKTLGLAAGAISTMAAAVRLLANAAQLVVDVATGNGLSKSWNEAKARQKEILADYGVQMKQAGAAVSGQTYELGKDTEATNKNAKEKNRAQIQAIEVRDQTVTNIKRITAAQEVAWAVEKARGRDSVQLAQMEAEQAKLNLETLRQKEEAVRAAQEAAGKPYRKSQDMLDAEVKAAKTLAAWYDALIDKKEKMGGFVTQTSKLLAEADALDQRGGDSGVKRYEALKTAVEEYLDGLKKLRDSQAQTTAGMDKMQAAADAARTGNLAQYQNMAAVIDQGEKVFQINALQERLGQIQQLSQAQNLGARERFSLYEQERQVFAELTGSIGSAIEGTMQKIQSMQSAAIGAASSAVGILDKVGATQSDYQALARMVSGLRLDTGNMNLQNLGQYANLIDSLKKKGASVDGMMPSVNEVFSALQKELTGVPEAINKLQTGLQSLAGLSAQVGAAAAENFWKPWQEKLNTLKAQIGSLANANFNPLSFTPAPVPIPESTASKAENKNVNVNVQTTNQFQGYTQDQMTKVVDQAKDRFGEELLAALQSANAQYGF